MKDNKALTIIAILFAVGFSVFVLKELQSILIPFFVAVIITFVFQPFYKWLRTKRIPSPVAIIIIIFVIIILANLSSVFIYASINSFTNDFPKYEEKFNDLYNKAVAYFNIPKEELDSFTESMKFSNLVKAGTLTAFFSGFFSGVVGIFGDFVLILIYVVFLFSEFTSIRKRIFRAFSHERGVKVASTLTDIFRDVRSYISGKTLLSLLQAVIIGFVLYIFGVDFFFVWALMMFFLHFIPNIGGLIATILPAFIMILQFESIVTPIIVTVILIVIQNVIGNIIEPKVLGDQLDLSPILLLISLIFWGYVWGIVGMILSVPIMSMIKIVLMNIPSTQPIAILMSYSMSSVKDVEDQLPKKRGRLVKIFKK